MGDDNPPLGSLRCDLSQSCADELVGQAMKAVAAYALIVEALRDGKAIGDLGVAPMEGRIEAGDLKHARLPLQDCLDRRQVVRLMQRRKGNEAPQALDDFRCDRRRLPIFATAMHDAMTHRSRQSATDLLPQE